MRGPHPSRLGLVLGLVLAPSGGSRSPRTSTATLPFAVIGGSLVKPAACWSPSSRILQSRPRSLARLAAARASTAAQWSGLGGLRGGGQRRFLCSLVVVRESQW